jgi:hypothetical protein
MTIRDSEEHVVVNHAAGEMVGPMATALHIRDFPPFISDEPSSRGGGDQGPTPLELLLGRYCPVDSLVRAAVQDYQVTWERL